MTNSQIYLAMEQVKKKQFSLAPDHILDLLGDMLITNADLAQSQKDLKDARAALDQVRDDYVQYMERHDVEVCSLREERDSFIPNQKAAGEDMESEGVPWDDRYSL